MRGRKPGPTPASALARPLAVALAEPDWTVVELPGWEDGIAQIAAERWSELKVAMEAAGTLGPENAGALEMLCVHYATWRLASAHVVKDGPITKAPSTGVAMHNPYLSVANGAADRYLKLSAELGLTPVMRGRVTRIKEPRETRASAAVLEL